SECKQEERHTQFVKLSLDFIDFIAGKYFPNDNVELNDEEKQAIVNAMAFNVNILNNPRKFNSAIFKTLL
ncbi:MAG: hypothetical protein K2J13_02250, partial [Clostridia bacterium]|nr:hypothetical protein [Clostridia bacterium]